jgi:hypothetical protein
MLEQGKSDKHTSLSRQDVNKKFYNKGQWCKDKKEMDIWENFQKYLNLINSGLQYSYQC